MWVLVAIFAVTAALFRSYAQAVIVMLTIPYSVAAAGAGHVLLGFDLSSVSIFGMIALGGLVVNSALVLTLRYNQLQTSDPDTALREAAAWPTRWGELNVSINVTPKVVEKIDLPGMVLSSLGVWDLSAENLIIEITEGAIMANPDASFRVLKQLRDLGVHVSIDDFGTGYSSLAYFKNIPANELKIDKSFVINMLEDAGDMQIVRAVLELARSFGLSVTAEGVEDASTATELRALGCDELQGYYYSKPLPQRDFVTWLENYSQESTVAASAARS